MNAQQVRDALLSYDKAYSATFAQVELETADELADAITHHLALVAELVARLDAYLDNSTVETRMDLIDARKCVEGAA